MYVRLNGAGTAGHGGEEISFKLSNDAPITRLWCLELDDSVLAFLWDQGGYDNVWGGIEAVDRRSGKTRWFTPLHTAHVGDPLVLRDSIIVAGPMLVARIDRAGGRVVWRHEIHESVGQADRPRLVDRKVVVEFPESGVALVLDPETGAKQRASK